MRRTVWHGTSEESLDLLAAVQEHCSCSFDRRGVRRASCPAHRMLVEDQRALDGLLFARRCLRDRARREEWRGGIGESRQDVSVAPYYFTPTARSASSVDEFLAICRAEPAVAAAHFERGYFEPWLRAMGQPGLADLSVVLRTATLDLFLSTLDERFRVPEIRQ